MSALTWDGELWHHCDPDECLPDHLIRGLWQCGCGAKWVWAHRSGGPAELSAWEAVTSNWTRWTLPGRWFRFWCWVRWQAGMPRETDACPVRRSMFRGHHGRG